MTGATENLDKLVRMANQIGAFFGAYPEETAIDGVREHVAKFWTTKMRAAVLDAIARGETDGIDPIVVRGFAQFAEKQAS